MLNFAHDDESFYKSVGITTDQMEQAAVKLAKALAATRKESLKSKSIEILYNAAMADDAVLLTILLKFYDEAMEHVNSMSKEKAMAMIKELAEAIPPELREKLGIEGVGAILVTKKGDKIIDREIIGDVPEDEVSMVDALIAKHKEEMGCDEKCDSCTLHEESKEASGE